MKQWYRIFGLAAVMACLMVCSDSVASRIPRPFDRAFESAELVLQGDVIELWNPFKKETKREFGHNSCYRMTVEKCFKGGLKPGAEVVFWDRHAGSTASFGLYAKGEYVVYLSPADLSGYEAKILNPGDGVFYRPIRVRSKGRVTADSFARELRLLDLFVEHPPADKRKAYRQLLENDSDPAFLAYIVKEWPRPCTKEDLALFKEMVMASQGKELHVQRMLGELLKHPDTLTDSEVAVLLQRGGVNSFYSLRPLITDRNIGALRALLFDFLRDTGAAGPYKQLIETLAALDPDYFKERFLASHDFPLWKLLPCLKALSLNGSDLGMADFPEEVFSVSHNRLLEISYILEGNLFYVSFPLCHPKTRHCVDFKAALPLLDPLLKEKDSPERRAAVALFRTYGVPVERTGGIYTAEYADAPAPCPVKLELHMERTTYTLGEEVVFFLKETTAVTGGVFCFEGQDLATLHFGKRWNSPQFLGEEVWQQDAPPREAFVVLENGMVREREVKLFRKIDRPGTYRIALKKCYPHDGGKYGLDAWSGMAFAKNELVFTVEEP